MANTKPAELAVRGTKLELSEDAHARVAILFVVEEPTEFNKITLIAVSVKWLLTHGVPIHPTTGEQMAYNGTYIIQ